MTKQHIFTPGQLLANIPGALGFYPTESVILMGFESQGDQALNDGAKALTLGPTMRIDIDDFEGLQHDVARALEPLETEMIFAFIVSQRPERLLDPVAQQLFNAGENCGLTIDACWHVPEIKQGQPYELWFGRDLSSSGTSSTVWKGGSIPTIAASPSMEAFVDRGELPELNRQEAVRPLTKRNTAFSREELNDMERSATALSQALSNGEQFTSDTFTYGIEDIIADVRNLLDEYGPLDAFAQDSHKLITAGTWLATTQTRDLVLAEFLDNPAPSADVLLATAQTFTGEIRANALSIYAATQIALGQSHRAGLALTCLMQENSDHRLGALFYRLYSVGLLDKIVEAAAEGSQVAQDMVFAEVAKKRKRLRGRKEGRSKQPGATAA